MLKKLVHSWLPVLVAFLIGAMFVGVAFAATTTFRSTIKAKNFLYLRPKLVKYVVPGSAFVAGGTTNPDHTGYSGQVDIPAGDQVVAAVNLPQGVTVTRVTVWSDTTSLDSFEMHLEANNPANDHVDMVKLFPVACASAPCATTSSTISPSVINNNLLDYGIWINDAGGGTTIYRVVITYRTSAVGPVSGLPAGANWSGPKSTNN